MIRPLAEVLNYQNDELVHRFKDDFSLSLADSQEIFLETKRWLWLCGHQAESVASGKTKLVKIPLLGEAYAIDLMWHTFLLFTRDYSSFCDHYFGFFIHHTPQTRAEKEDWEKKIALNTQSALTERRVLLKEVYEYIYDNLGGDVLKKWCEEFPARFKFD